MDIDLFELLYDWAFRNYPPLLNDEPAFQNLHDLMHLLLQKERQEQLRRLYPKLNKPSQN